MTEKKKVNEWLKRGKGRQGKQVFIRAYDGDTVFTTRAPKRSLSGELLRVKKRRQSTRMMHYDAEEMGKPGSLTAKAKLHEYLVRGMRIKDSGRTDKYNRRLAEATLTGPLPLNERREVGARMIQQGLAEPYFYSSKYRNYKALRFLAWQKNLGIHGNKSLP